MFPVVVVRVTVLVDLVRGMFLVVVVWLLSGGMR